MEQKFFTSLNKRIVNKNVIKERSWLYEKK